MSRVRLKNWGDHPIVTVITVLASVVAILAYFQSCGEPEPELVAADPCVDVIGRWDWLTTGGIVSIAEGGGLGWHSTVNAPTPAVIGLWTCDQKTERIELRWSTGLVDDLALSEDGDRLSGSNVATGVTISATRTR